MAVQPVLLSIISSLHATHLSKIKQKIRLKVLQHSIIISGVESRNSERAFNYALVFADKMFFQGLYVFYLTHLALGLSYDDTT